MKRLNFTTDAQTLYQDDDGTIRVRGSRVTLDTLITAFKRGDTAEQIHEGFPSLKLAQVYSTISWYLNDPAVADEYLKVREVEGNVLRREIEDQPDYGVFQATMRQRRERLIKS